MSNKVHEQQGSVEQINRVFYAKAAASYEQTGRINDEGNRQRIQRLLQRVIRSENWKVLDVCCGAGLYLSQLKQRVHAENLFGIDISAEMLEFSKRHCRNLQESSVYTLPFEDRTFDMVTCSSALHHIEDLERALKEIYRVLKPGGIFLSDYDNNVRYAAIVKWQGRASKVMRVRPALAAILKKAAGKKAVEAPVKLIEEMTVEELHRHAETQNMHHDGLRTPVLKRALQRANFKEIRFEVFSSDNWNDGVLYGWIPSFSNNKLCSISKKLE